MIENLGYDSSKGLSIVVEKHGTHDQKTHGSWATGVSSGVVSDIQRFTREWGGLSISMVDGHQPTDGYMVAKPPEFGIVVDEADFFDSVKGPKILADYMKKNRADLGRGGKDYLGTWLNEGKIYLDVSQNIMSREEGIRIGRERNQKAIWDVVNQVEIDTGGTGEVQKGNQDGSTSRHLNDDGRRNRRLRTGDLGEVGKAKVIRFAPGLVPVLKHEGGPDHDQKSHGNWATGGYTAEQQAGMAEMEDKGPSINDLDNLYDALLGADVGPSLDDMVSIVENDQGLYEQAIEGIEERVAALLEESKYEYEDQEAQDKANADLYNRLYEQTQNEMIDEFISEEREMIQTLFEEQNGGSAQSKLEEMTGFMNEVYSYEHSGKDVYGNDVNLYSEVTMIEPSSYVNGGIKIYGEVKDGNNIAGVFERTMYKEEGVWMVEHDIFTMDDDYKGTGFGTKFIQQQEDWYTTRKFGAVVVGTAWDGARHWARAGYDWHPEYLKDSIASIASEAGYNDNFEMGTENRKTFDSLMSRVVEGWQPEVSWSTQAINGVKFKPITNDDFPLPNDFATIGIASKTRDSEGTSNWGGKSLMENLNLKYTKILTAEGRSVLDGAIDRDGDGLIYDGTAREKPAPTVNSTP